MHTVEKFVTSAHPEIVWSVLADVEHWCDWTPTVVEIKPLTSAGLRLGAQYRIVQPRLRPAIYEITHWIPNQRFTWVQKILGGGMVADHRIEPRDGGSAVELSFTSEGLPANIVGSLFSKMIRDYVATEARSLKNRCDALAMQTLDHSVAS